MVTNRDAQGMSKRFTELARICHGSATDRHGQICRQKNCTKDWSYDCFLIHKPFLRHSVADPVDPTMFLRIFIPVEASRMKGMPQGHPGWV